LKTDDDSALRVRLARVGDAQAIAGVLVAGWRSAYAGLLPAEHLAGMSVRRHAAQHHAMIAAGGGVLVAEAGDRVVGFCTVGSPRTKGLAEGELETLYVLDDWRDRGLGRRLLQSGALHLAAQGCRSLFLWVLEDNPSRWFYERLGGRRTQRSTTYVAGRPFLQTAYVWDPIELLTGAGTKL
jgi:ribosomal protein S18 acetylase RimI-like enzyme